MSDYTVVVQPQVSNYTVVVEQAESQISVVTANNNGRSAYEDAVANGYVGTVNEWLASLVGGGIGATFVYTQSSPANNWIVNHDLDKYPSITILDTEGFQVEADVEYTSLNQVVLTFNPAFAGKVIAN
jgi:phosphosulfolactate phosphohydrolase-like enzyme